MIRTPHPYGRWLAIWGSFLMLVPPCAMHAQDLRKLKELPFIGHATNTIVHRGDSSAWSHWQGALDTLIFQGKGQINVVHIGGSHVQADMWSMQLRHRLQTMAPGIRAGRGFIFPYNMAKSNNPYWYEPVYTGKWSAVRNVHLADSSTLGLSGISVTTRDSVTTLKVSFRGDVYSGYTFNRVKVLHRQDSSFTVTAWSPDSTLFIERENEPDLQATTFSFSRYTDTLHLKFTRMDSTQALFTLNGLLLESDDPGIFLHASGVNGASTASWLRCQRFSEDLALVHPDLVILSIGINDAHDPDFKASRFKANYEQIIQRIRVASPGCAILLTTNTDSFIKRRTANKRAEDVRQVMLELSQEQGVAVWDALGVMGGVGSIRSWEGVGLAKRDRIHLTREGYALLGDLLYDALMEDLDAHLRHAYRP